jgi:hypothetical protein
VVEGLEGAVEFVLFAEGVVAEEVELREVAVFEGEGAGEEGE